MLEIFDPFHWAHPEAAGLLALLGLAYGLAGWRLARCLTALNAAAVGIWIASQLTTNDWVNKLGAVILAWSLGFVCWRYHRRAISAMSAVLAFAITRYIVAEGPVPLVVSVLAAATVAAFTIAMSLTFFQETAAVVTGIQGGWFLTTALSLACSLRTGTALSLPFTDSAFMFLIWVPICGILTTVQWADLRHSRPELSADIA